MNNELHVTDRVVVSAELCMGAVHALQGQKGTVTSVRRSQGEAGVLIDGTSSSVSILLKDLEPEELVAKSIVARVAFETGIKPDWRPESKFEDFDAFLAFRDTLPGVPPVPT